MGEAEPSEFRETEVWNPHGWSRGLREGRRWKAKPSQSLGWGLEFLYTWLARVVPLFPPPLPRIKINDKGEADV